MSIKLEDNKLILGDRAYHVDKAFLKVMKAMLKRTTQDKPKLDSLLVNEGKEGSGKSNSSCVEAAIVKALTGRDIHLFFRIEALIQFAQSTKEKIIIWDEPSLDSLSTDQLNSLNRDVLRLFMTIRKNRHYFIVNYTKFWKFPEYIVVDRANGMVHMHETVPGKFRYIKQRSLEKLWNDYHKKRERNFVKYAMIKIGDMPEIMEKSFAELDMFVNQIPHATFEVYDMEKSLAISSIRQSSRINKDKLELKKFKAKIAKLKMKEINTKEQLAAALGVTGRSLERWKVGDFEENDFLEKDGDIRLSGQLVCDRSDQIINKSGDLGKKSDDSKGKELFGVSNNYEDENDRLD